MILVERQILRVAIGGRRRGKDDPLAPRRVHRREQVHRPGDIGLVIEERQVVRFPYGLQSREVDDGVGREIADRAGQGVCVANIGLNGDEVAVGQLAHPRRATGELLQ
jgi:hypothetical protein